LRRYTKEGKGKGGAKNSHAEASLGKNGIDGLDINAAARAYNAAKLAEVAKVRALVGQMGQAGGFLRTCTRPTLNILLLIRLFLLLLGASV
jgi:hypothetical protein